MYIRAASRQTISKSIFSTTFMVAFTLAIANSLVPCPADRNVSNDSSRASKETRERLQREQQLKRSRQENETKIESN
ncbi:DEKNAAC105591 [Brettanomyces naardenensis]|uniref:DEKNAAC105591 n=1 Tax=Brettanomyces naardenensis TaxID=13370 RepID=A0A448YU35_BRENA|nr:DEKNAAC105591 [Brettanomyces naardenensis]